MRNVLLYLTGWFIVLNINGQTDVSGTIAGMIWTKDNSPYNVIGDIQIAGLEIQAGVSVIFTGDYIFEVAGILKALGTEQEPVLFKAGLNVTSWKGILFQNTVPGSRLSWCIVENANTSGIRIIESLPSLEYCIIRKNSTVNSGGGLKISLTITGSLDIKNCIIENNSTSTNYTVPASDGGGIWVSTENASVRFIDCIIKGNSAYGGHPNVSGGGGYVSGNVEFIRTLIQGNSVRAAEGLPGGSSYGRGGGIYINKGPTTFANTTIIKNNVSGTAPGGMSGNAGYAQGGGIHINKGPVMIINSILDANKASSTHGTKGGGVFTNTTKTEILNSTLVRNIPHAIYANLDTVEVMNSILYFNNNNNDQVTGKVNIAYSDIQGGFTGQGNINYNPILLNDTVAIIVEGSPAIDAGNPDPAYDDTCFPPSLGGNRNDMGSNGGPGACDWSVMTSVEDIFTSEPSFFKLEQNYPNPFSLITNIRYELHENSEVLMEIINILGQRIRTLLCGNQEAGSYNLEWDGCDDTGFEVSNGIYFYRMHAGNYVRVKKMLLIR